jgi:hypothetical protein
MGLVEDQLTSAPGINCPAWSRTSATRLVELPAGTGPGGRSEIITDAGSLLSPAA